MLNKATKATKSPTMRSSPVNMCATDVQLIADLHPGKANMGMNLTESCKR